MILKKRAIHEWQKRDVMEKMLKLWIENTHLRLGQLIINAIGKDTDLYNIEDYDLIEKLFTFNNKFNFKNKP